MTILRSRQKVFVERSLAALEENKNTLGVAPTGCHAPGTPILMYDGTLKNVEAIRVGDELMGPDSTPRIVEQLHHGNDMMYEVIPRDGDAFIVNQGHILSLVRSKTTKDRIKRLDPLAGSIVNLSVGAYLEQSASFQRSHTLYRAKIDFPVTMRPSFYPYFLGIFLACGNLKSRTPSITTDREYIVEFCRDMLGYYAVDMRESDTDVNKTPKYSFYAERFKKNPLKMHLKNLGVWGSHRRDIAIPHLYKAGSRHTRRYVLAALLDCCGKTTPKGITCRVISEQLAEDTAFIARSLGLHALVTKKKIEKVFHYDIAICGNFIDLPITLGKHQLIPRCHDEDVLITPFSLNKCGTGDYYGFSVDKDQLYVMGDFTVTHNSGKTIMLSGATGQWLNKNDGAKACVLAHRDELTEQNNKKFLRVNPSIKTSVFDAKEKSFNGDTTFAMVQTLSRENNLKQLPTLDMLVIDEAHHAAADSYRRIIDTAYDKNPDLLLYGVTATPNRGDKKGLRDVFSNVADQITLSELIASGHLVPPKTLVIDVGVQEELSEVSKLASDLDMGAVDEIMNKTLINEEVVKHWQRQASDRPTIIFCSTIGHAVSVMEAFKSAGVKTEVVHGEMSKTERKDALARYESGESQVVVNVAVLTEGYDFQPTSCVILLRPSSFHSTMIQMIGRGLRTVDPDEHPGVIKKDCIVLDFGTSSILHGKLEQKVDLDGGATGEAPKKECPECGAHVPLGLRECPLCGYHWEKQDKEEQGVLTEFVLSEIDLLNASAFRWSDLFNDGSSLLATGFEAWSGAFFLNGRWYSVGGTRQRRARLLSVGEKVICIAAANDWLSDHENDDGAKKSKSWLNQAATKQQLKYLPQEKFNFGLTRYQAACLLAFHFNKMDIRRTIFRADKEMSAA